MNCIRCGNTTSRSGRKFCSVECYRESQKKEPEQKLCLNCGVVFMFTDPGGGNKRSGKYCSRSCATTFSNKISPKRTKTQRAERRKHTSVFDIRTVGYYRERGSNRFGLAARREARKYAKSANLIRECNVCGYNFYVHLAHIRPLADFTDDEIMSTTWINNVAYLCPNHHYEYDHGKITI